MAVTVELGQEERGEDPRISTGLRGEEEGEGDVYMRLICHPHPLIQGENARIPPGFRDYSSLEVGPASIGNPNPNPNPNQNPNPNPKVLLR